MCALSACGSRFCPQVIVAHRFFSEFLLSLSFQRWEGEGDNPDRHSFPERELPIANDFLVSHFEKSSFEIHAFGFTAFASATAARNLSWTSFGICLNADRSSCVRAFKFGD
jgi:hypothetical protein